MFALHAPCPHSPDAHIKRAAAQDAALAAGGAGSATNGNEVLGRGAPRNRARVVRYTPKDKRREKAEQNATNAARQAAQRAAVTAELRAIGTQPDATRTLLRRVPARLVRNLCSSIKGEAASLAGRAFADGSKHWIVADVAPSGRAHDGHTVAYVFDAAARIKVVGRLSESCDEMEVKRVKQLLRQDAADPMLPVIGPTADYSESLDDFGCDVSGGAPEQQQQRVATVARALIHHELGLPRPVKLSSRCCWAAALSSTTPRR